MDLLFLVCTWILGNIQSQSHSTEAVMQNINIGSLVRFSGVIKGRPFQAEFEQVILKKLPDGQTQHFTINGLILRDSEGRRRQEIRLISTPENTLSFTFILDPITKVIYVLDVINKTVSKDELQVSPELNSTMALVPQDENLTVKHIEGLLCHGFQTNLPNGELEFWFSEDLKEDLLERSLNREQEKSMRLFNIRRIEPDTNLFIVPPDYKQINIIKKKN
jgi:hypothetical protein